MSGKRFNKGKLELTQCPTSAVAAIAAGFAYNSEKFGGKYPDSNWRQGMSWMSVINCLERHVTKFKDGEDIDHESGLPHLFMIGCNFAILMEYYMNGLGTDDREMNKGMIDSVNQILQEAIEKRNG